MDLYDIRKYIQKKLPDIISGFERWIEIELQPDFTGCCPFYASLPMCMPICMPMAMSMCMRMPVPISRDSS